MPAAFYARYVPPVVAKKSENDHPQDINPRPAKKKKLSKSQEEEVLQQPSNPDVSKEENHVGKTIVSYKDPLAAEVERILTKEKPRKKDELRRRRAARAAREAAAEEEAEPDDTEDKHKSIRAKFKQASKVAEDLDVDIDEQESEGEVLEKVQPVGIQPLPQPKRVHDEPKSTISALPDWLAKPVTVRSDETAPFENLDLGSDTIQRLANAGFENAFAIQTAVLPMLLPGCKQYRGDICVSAATGSGKTLAYTLPLIEALKDKPVTRLRAVIVVPTRELVTQVQEVFRITGSSLKVGTAVGSKSLKEEQALLIEIQERYDPVEYKKKYVRDMTFAEYCDLHESSDEDSSDEDMPTKDHIYQRFSKVDILICTPGRLVDHIRSTKGFTLEHLQWLIIDEADRLLDQSFQQWVDIVMPQLEREPKQENSFLSKLERLTLKLQPQVRKVILSATMTRDYSKLVALNLRTPVLVAIEGADRQQNGVSAVNHDDDQALMSLPRELEEIVIPVKDAADKPLYLIQLIEEALFHKTNGHTTDLTTSNTDVNMDSDTTSSDGSSSTSSDSDTSDSDSDSDVDTTSTSSSSSEDSTSSDSSSDSDSSSAAPASPQPSKSLQPNTSPPKSHGILIFTSTTESALRLSRLVSLLRPLWTSQISTLTSSTRTSSHRKTLSAFRGGKLSILIATDLASRGLDIKTLGHVVNYDIPHSVTSYVHRVGRTARAGGRGKAWTLVSHHEGRWFWGEIGRNEAVRRERAVERRNLVLVEGEGERERYQDALVRLGREAKGERD